MSQSDPSRHRPSPQRGPWALADGAEIMYVTLCPHTYPHTLSPRLVSRHGTRVWPWSCGVGGTGRGATLEIRNPSNTSGSKTWTHPPVTPGPQCRTRAGAPGPRRHVRAMLGAITRPKVATVAVGGAWVRGAVSSLSRRFGPTRPMTTPGIEHNESRLPCMESIMLAMRPAWNWAGQVKVSGPIKLCQYRVGFVGYPPLYLCARVLCARVLVLVRLLPIPTRVPAMLNALSILTACGVKAPMKVGDCRPLWDIGVGLRAIGGNR